MRIPTDAYPGRPCHNAASRPIASPPPHTLARLECDATFPIATAARPHAVPRGSVSPGLLVRSVGTNGQVSSWGANQAGAPPSAAAH